jgi:hypothetical protein
MENYTYELILKKSVGNLNFGESRQSILQNLGEPERTRTGKFSIKDWYFDLGLSIEYRPSDEACKHITVLSTASLIYEGNDLLRLSWGELVSWLHGLDPTAKEEGLGLVSKRAGISIYPTLSEDGDCVLVDVINIFDPQYRASKEEIEAEARRQIAEMPSDEECVWTKDLDDATIRSLFER